MRVDASHLVFLYQTSVDGLDGLSRAPWPALLFLALIGGTAGAAKIWSFVAEHLREKREIAKRAADEDRARRDAKTKAEIEQIEALTSMARDVPKQFDSMATRFDAALSKIGETNALMAKRIDENTSEQRALRSEVHELKDELRSDTRALVSAIAGKLGIQSNQDETNASGVRRLSVPSSPGLELQGQRA